MSETTKKSNELNFIINLLFDDKTINDSFFDKINYEKLVKICSANLLIPSLYYKLFMTNKLEKVPKDFKIYLSEIFKINKNRNEKLLIEIKEISKHFNKENINFCFVKGSSLILNNVFNSYGERMINDIDILVDKKSFLRSIEILKENGYRKRGKGFYINEMYRHYPRLINKNKLFAVEIHDKLMRYPHNDKINPNSFLKNKLLVEEEIYVSKIENEREYLILNQQINDWGYLKMNYNFRNMYDFFLLKYKSSEELIYENKYQKNYISLFNKFGIKSFNKTEKLNNLNYFRENLRKLRYFRKIDNFFCEFYIIIYNLLLKLFFSFRKLFHYSIF